MRMPWRRHDKRMTEGQLEATAAVQEASEALAEVRAAAPQVAKVAATMKRLRAENHFAESLEAALRGGH
jgi:hypothetical protein